MGALIAVLDKRGEDATETAVAMLKTLKMGRADTFGIASPSKVRIGKTLDALQSLNLDSPIALGHAFSRILERDRPQPIELENATLVFEGRTLGRATLDAEGFIRKLRQNFEEAVKTFINKTEGAFAFTAAMSERLLAGRDPIGVQPLYYGENVRYEALASERAPLWKVGIKTANSFSPGHMASITKQGFKFNPVKTLVYSEPKQITMKTAATRLQALLQKSTRERVSGLKEVALAFSGGLDSSTIASLVKRTRVHVSLIHVSLKDQTETDHAKEAAEWLGLPIDICLYEEEAVEKVLQKVLRLIEEPDPLKASIAIPFYWTAERAAEKNLKVLLAGQGADELFGGYKRYADEYLKYGGEKARKTMFNDIVKLHETNLERDVKTCNSQGVELRLPFAAWQIAKFASELPIELKLGSPDDRGRKLVMRQVAKNLKLPPFIVEKPKRALQYATGVSRTLQKLAEKEDLSLREYLQKMFRTVFKEIVEDE